MKDFVRWSVTLAAVWSLGAVFWSLAFVDAVTLHWGFVPATNLDLVVGWRPRSWPSFVLTLGLMLVSLLAAGAISRRRLLAVPVAGAVAVDPTASSEHFMARLESSLRRRASYVRAVATLVVVLLAAVYAGRYFLHGYPTVGVLVVATASVGALALYQDHLSHDVRASFYIAAVLLMVVLNTGISDGLRAEKIRESSVSHHPNFPTVLFIHRFGTWTLLARDGEFLWVPNAQVAEVDERGYTKLLPLSRLAR